MDCGTTNLHYCDECGERKRELSFTYQVIKKETVKKNVISLKDLKEGVYKPVEIIEDERMRVLKLEDERGEFHFIDQKRYSLNKEALRDYSKIKEEDREKEARRVDLLSELESLTRRDTYVDIKWKKYTYLDSLFVNR
jgi:uncharacterized protein YjcR